RRATPLRSFLFRDTVMTMNTAPNHPDNLRAAVAAEVRAAIARDGRTSAEVARAADISRASLSRKMRCQASFTVDELVRIAGALGIEAGGLVASAVGHMQAA